ncbi:AAA family ATPase [endosymbiont of Ridgeia piscesae]|jgi:MoxR-like ATPase|uniref:MoxR-like ATPase n=1 Tax=endosymbiont of Ridgeia piscesae TaxID=54398 RepID=A0A0T5YTU0_9GAMM|nr:AAA family ATPase [endosymbiont of Ridgeia piscesae]KRT54032.1 MoxR-like ATPase [endosymbiont of Ridgeia piscesae]KRT60257.1 MoxR-like ATPase [endosymbiont of Ridgeia piscesae]
MTAELQSIIEHAGEILLGKRDRIRLAICCLLARGHLLIEDIPGVGKTTLAHTLAHLLGMHYQRIQFTSELLPADILGVSVYDRQRSDFVFHPGPIFSQLVLADEINRATPKAQSALLEAMEERQVTVEGETRALPQPFFVIATQNPSHQIGTFPLPESQLDRFTMRIGIGYPDRAAERQLLSGTDRRSLLEGSQPLLSPEQLEVYQQQVASIHISEALLDYCQNLLAYSRSAEPFRQGLSPRAGLAMLQTARAWAMLEGRNHVLPEDLQAVLSATIGHRLFLTGEEEGGSGAVSLLLESVAVD